MKKILTLIIAIIGFISCDKELEPETPPLETRKIFISGYEKNPLSDNLDRAKYWVNETENLLTNGQTASQATGIATIFNTVTGHQVHVAGYEYQNNVMTARVWRDKIALTINTGGGASAANGICTLGNDYYVCGFQENASGTQAVYWKNGVRTFLTTENAFAYATAITVENNNIYVCGFVKNGDLKKAVYWVNNSDPIYLDVNTIATYNSTADAIVYKNNKLYIAGNFKATLNGGENIAMYWVDGVNNALGQEYAGAILTSIAVDDLNNIFIAGSKLRNGNPVGAIWKNNIEEPFETTSVNSRVYGLFMTQNNFYKCGFSDGVKATYWQATNGRQVIDSKTSYATSIFASEF